MFRATVLSIVLMFVAGSSVPALCRVWCDPHPVAAAGCHHQDIGSETGSKVSDSGDACCLDRAAQPTVLTEGRWRQASPGAELVVSIPKFRLTAPALGDRPFEGSGPSPPTQKRPLPTPLRI